MVACLCSGFRVKLRNFEILSSPIENKLHSTAASTWLLTQAWLCTAGYINNLNFALSSGHQRKLLLIQKIQQPQWMVCLHEIRCSIFRVGVVPPYMKPAIQTPNVISFFSFFKERWRSISGKNPMPSENRGREKGKYSQSGSNVISLEGLWWALKPEIQLWHSKRSNEIG